jgi:carbon starvation protein
LFSGPFSSSTGLALLLITVYLARKRSPVVNTALPMIFMLAMTGWAMGININQFLRDGDYLLFSIAIAVSALEIWMVVESFLVLKRLNEKQQTSDSYDP